MKKILNFLSEHMLFVVSLFLLVFIPLYPKLPLFDIQHTWVYIRIEDFLMGIVWVLFFVQLWRKKATLKTPLTVPIIAFWLIGGIATLHAILFIFPDLQNVFPQLGLLHWLRRIEYLSLFFLGFSAMRKKSFVTPLIITLAVTLIIVFLYGLGQRYLGFPAFLTMNEEFAKGVPLKLSALSRVASTFAGHYDLAAYLALLIPVMGSMVLGFKKWYARIFFFLTAVAGLILLLMTASRVSFGVYLLSISLLLVLHKQKKLIIPVLIGSFLLMQSFTGISQRFSSTFQQVDLIVDSRTGKAIGVASEVNNGQVVIEDEQSTGENLPGGSSYINVPTTTTPGKETEIVYKSIKPGTNEEQIISKSGAVIVKKAFAYDVSFTTRFQGTWPRAIEAFNRNIFLGSGYSSINVASDNNYLRVLGETGILGLLSFLMIFLIAGIYFWKVLPSVTDKKARALVLGVFAGIFGVALNAVLIDVFEASKLAFVMWLLLGLTLGLARLYEEHAVNFFVELRKIFLSAPAFVVYLIATGFIVFAPSLNNYFVADDFTWLRWAADCSTRVTQTCEPFLTTIFSFFTNSQDFFYRPGMKALFYVMYPVFELFPMPFHLLSVLAHITATVFVFFLARRFLQSTTFGFVTAAFFLVLGIHFEAIYWISSIGHLISSVLILGSLTALVYYHDTKRKLLLALAWISILVATFFHEFAAIGALLLIAYDLVIEGKEGIKAKKLKWYYLLFLLLIPLYFVLRTFASSLWMSGDYSYNLVKLPFNAVGNTIGYFFVSLLGPDVIPYYESVRTLAASNKPVTAVVMLVVIAAVVFVLSLLRNRFSKRTITITLISLVLFIVPLIPFLGLGNIAPRYAYLASFGVCLMVAYFLELFLLSVRKKQRSIALIAYLIVFAIIIYFNVAILFRLNKDWGKAGDIVNDTLVGVTYTYTQEKKLPVNPTFTFVNVPIRYASAWVFPVGLQDALWFSFRDTKLTVTSTGDEEQARSKARSNPAVKVFKFLQDGSIVEYEPPPLIRVTNPL